MDSRRNLKKYLAVAVLFVVGVWLCESPVFGKYSGGTGEANDPYRIATAEDLNDIDNHPNDLNKHFIMVSDINLAAYSGTKFNVIGQYSWWTSQGWAFDGIFDGNGHSIFNFSYNNKNQESVGIFGWAGPNSVIKNVYIKDANVIGYYWVGLLVASNEGTVSNCRATGRILGEENVGGLVGYSEEGSMVSNCSADIIIEIKDDIYAFAVGGLVGYNHRGTIEDSFVDVNIQCSTETYYTGALAGFSRGTIRKCSAQGKISSGRWHVGGLVGVNEAGIGDISICYTTVDVNGCIAGAGGLVGKNYAGHVFNSYARGNVNSHEAAGGLFGYAIWGDATNCYSTAMVTGNAAVGGLVGSEYRDNTTYKSCFWNIDNNPDVNGHGTRSDPNIIGKTTAQMQDASTYMEAGWDFNMPIWKFCSLPDYPKLAWQACPGPEAPVLASEPDITVGTSNTIFWGAVAEANDYLAECANDVNFAGVVYDSGWIMDTNCTFVGLEVGQQYFYRVKARDASGIESEWSNVESSVQVTLGEAVETVLDANSLQNENMMNALLNKIDAAQAMIDDGLNEQALTKMASGSSVKVNRCYNGALGKLENEILAKTDGCAEGGEPDKNDWIVTCEGQDEVYPLIMETIEYVMGLME